MRLCPQTILAVEDSADEIFFLQNAFDQLGYGERVRFARDGTEAVDYISGVGVYADRNLFPFPCIVMTDLKMPLMDGFELITWIRAKSPHKTIPAFVLTSSRENADSLRAKTCGANGFFQKPNAGGSLVAVLKQIESSWMSYVSLCTGYNPRPCG